MRTSRQYAVVRRQTDSSWQSAKSEAYASLGIVVCFPLSAVRSALLPLLAYCFLLLTVSTAQEKFLPYVTPSEVEGSQSASSSAGNPRYQILNINNLTTWHRSDGHSNHSPGADNGLYYPRGTGNIIYQDCIVWGGKVFRDMNLSIPYSTDPLNQNIRVGGGTYGIGTRAGAVTGSGVIAQAEDQHSADVRVYRIRRDYATMTDNDYLRDAQTYYEHASTNDVTQSEIDQLRSWYAADWTNWPVAKGAPFIDRNGNGVYDPPPLFNTDPNAGPLFTAESLMAHDYDEPGVAGGDYDLPADQVLWMVYNDLYEADVTNFVGSRPLGLEIQKTVWGYDRPDVLGNMYFVRYVFINKGGVDTWDQPGEQKGSFWIDSMYIGQWSDPDLGSFSDDLIGVDTTLSLAFVYNANPVDATFRAYNLPPPAAGYDFLAGPTVPSPGDSAVVRFRRAYDIANLGAYAFTYVSAGSPFTDPPGGDYLRDTGRWWNMLRGFQPLGDMTTVPQLYDSPPGIATSRFPLSGDPVLGTGWLDGLGTTGSFVPGDRRFTISTGPFRMAPGDTQEVYIGFTAGIGADRLSSLAVVKWQDETVQAMFDNLFRVPKPPATPKLTAAGLDREIILTWGMDAVRVKETEEKVIAGTFEFEGYNVYQLPAGSSKLSDGIKLATFDVKNGVTSILESSVYQLTGFPTIRIVQQGDDEGIQRSLRVTVDRLLDPGNEHARDPLVNGKEYTFAVTAYNRNTVTGIMPASLESEPSVMSVKSRVPFGVHIPSRYGDTVVVTHTAGASEARVSAIVKDPLAVTGEDYTIMFDMSGTVPSLSITNPGTSQGSSYSFLSDYLTVMVDGIDITIENVSFGFNNILVVANAGGPLSPPEAGAFAFQGFPTPGNGNPSATQQVGGGQWSIHTSMSITNDGSYAAFLDQISGYGELRITDGLDDYEIRFTPAGGYAYAPRFYLDSTDTGGQLVQVPFELWCVGSSTPGDPADDYRMWPYLFDTDSNGVFNLVRLDHTGSGSDNDPHTDSFSWIEPLDRTPGSSGYSAILSAIQADPAGHRYLDTALFKREFFREMVLVSWNGGSVTDISWPSNVNQLMPENGTVFRLEGLSRIRSSDVYTFTSPRIEASRALEEKSADRIGVFPNPYYARNEWATSSLKPFVTFNNLPRVAVIRIYNLAGHLVRTLRKETDSQFFEWDLRNEHSWLVASGMYICLVEMPELRLQRIVKLAVIQENPVPN